MNPSGRSEDGPGASTGLGGGEGVGGSEVRGPVTRTAAIGATFLPGGVIYGGIGFLFITNSYPLFLALPAVVIAFGCYIFVQPLIDRYAAATGARDDWFTAFKPDFFRFYLDGPALVFAFVLNYGAAAVALGGWLFLWGAGLFG